MISCSSHRAPRVRCYAVLIFQKVKLQVKYLPMSDSQLAAVPARVSDWGVSAVTQWNEQHLCSTRTQVRSLAQHSGFKDPMLPHLHSLQLWFGSDPWPRNSICLGVAKKEKKETCVGARGQVQRSGDGRKNRDLFETSNSVVPLFSFDRKSMIAWSKQKTEVTTPLCTSESEA